MIRILYMVFVFVSFSYGQSILTDPYQNHKINLYFVKQNYVGDEAIEVKISIENASENEYSFELSDILLQSVEFELTTSQNEIIEIDPILEAKLKSTYANPSLYRTITLMPGEEFSRFFDLREFYDVRDFNTYYVKGIFYPDPYNKSVFVASDHVSFIHTPPVSVQQAIEVKAIERAQELIASAQLPPTEVIESFFESQLSKDWEKFLLHIDPNRLIYSFRNFSTQYDATMDASFKFEILERFKRFLTVHWDIPLVSYNIIDTTIKGDVAIVTVDAMESIRFTSRRIRYSFTLNRNFSGSWLISSYDVLALN